MFDEQKPCDDFVSNYFEKVCFDNLPVNELYPSLMERGDLI
jgi:hypothetical protein